MAENNNTALVVHNKQGLQQLLEGMRSSIADVLPRHLTPERVMKMALVAASRNPRLFECTKASIAKALITASELGLDCSGTLGSGYLVPFRNNKTGQYEVQFIAGYRGLIDLARRGGQIRRIEAHPVYQNDQFAIEFGLDPKLHHSPTLEGEPGPLKAVYAVAEMADGSKQSEVMTKAEVEAIRKRSRAGNDGPWVTDYTEMARKTVVRRLAKYLPLSAELEQVLALENEAEERAAVTQSVAREMIDDGRSATERLAEKVRQQQQEGESLAETSAQAPEEEAPPAPAPEKPKRVPRQAKATVQPPAPATEPEPQPKPATALTDSQIVFAVDILWPTAKAADDDWTQLGLANCIKSRGEAWVLEKIGYDPEEFQRQIAEASETLVASAE